MAAVKEAFDRGINFFDTSPFYGDTRSETVGGTGGESGQYGVKAGVCRRGTLLILLKERLRCCPETETVPTPRPDGARRLGRQPLLALLERLSSRTPETKSSLKQPAAKHMPPHVSHATLVGAPPTSAILRQATQPALTAPLDCRCWGAASHCSLATRLWWRQRLGGTVPRPLTSGKRRRMAGLAVRSRATKPQHALLRAEVHGRSPGSLAWPRVTSNPAVPTACVAPLSTVVHLRPDPAARLG